MEGKEPRIERRGQGPNAIDPREFLCNPPNEASEKGEPEGDEEEGDEGIGGLEIDEVGTEEGLEEVVAEVMRDGLQMPGQVGVEVIPAHHFDVTGKACVSLCVWGGGW
jgi:hypothetical protein